MKYIKNFEKLKISDINIDDYIFIKSKNYNGIDLIQYAKIINKGTVKTNRVRYNKIWFKIEIYNKKYERIITTCFLEDIIRKLKISEIDFFDSIKSSIKYNL